jgi:hypothetical protein
LKVNNLGKQLEAMGKQTTARLTFTAQSWIISLFFKCPLAYVKLGVICPNSTEIAIVTVLKISLNNYYSYFKHRN